MRPSHPRLRSESDAFRVQAVEDHRPQPTELHPRRRWLSQRPGRQPVLSRPGADLPVVEGLAETLGGQVEPRRRLADSSRGAPQPIITECYTIVIEQLGDEGLTSKGCP